MVPQITRILYGIIISGRRLYVLNSSLTKVHQSVHLPYSFVYIHCLAGVLGGRVFSKKSLLPSVAKKGKMGNILEGPKRWQCIAEYPADYPKN
jgi:hypothetical protein